MKLLIIPLVLTGIATILTTLQAFLVWRLSRGQRPFGGGLHEQAGPPASPDSRRVDFTPTPRVSILKPLCGLDDALLDNLRSFAALEGISYEVILSVADPDDPALALAQRLIDENPAAPFRLVIGGSRAANPKVERLIAAAEHARGEILFISDSNVRVDPWDIAATVRHFEDPSVGCVSNLFTGAGSRSLGATLEALHLLMFVVPGCTLAAAAATPCVVGKSMAIRRAVLEAIGGFASFARVLAEDQAIGLAVHHAGYRVVLSPIVIRNVVVQRSVGRALARQIRWNKIRFSFSAATYTAEFFLYLLPWSVLAWALSVGSPIGATVVGAAVGIRIIQAAVIRHATAAPITPLQLLAVPLQDFLQFCGQFVPYFSNSVRWRNHRMRIGPGTLMLLPGEPIRSAA